LGRPADLAEITKERLRRAAAKVEPEHERQSHDFGFRVFKLDSSNIRPWDPHPEDLEATLFDSMDHLKSGRTEDDILFEVLLKLGLDLTVPMEERTIAGMRVHSIGGGVLFVCLATEVRADDAEALAMGIVDWRDELDPTGEVSVVFRDSGFENDVAKSNVAAILEQHGVETVRSL
jgi:adenine-specific DNA-methyltransferase